MHSYNLDYPIQDGILVEQANLARARHRSYWLLSRLFQEGITPQLLPILEQLDPFAAFVADRFNEDEAAAKHYHLFGFNVFAHEAIFLSSAEDWTRGQLGGELARNVERFYQQVGYAPEATDLSVDHIACELGLLAYLSAREAEAWEDGRTNQAHEMQQRQSRFLSEHLLRWLPALSEAIRYQQEPFFGAVADLTHDLVEDHALDLSTRDLIPVSVQSWLPAPPDLLHRDKTGLKEIAAYLTTPALSAVYLSRDTLGRLAQLVQLPRGFGSRQQLLENLLHAAVQYDSLVDVLSALEEIVDHWDRSYETAFVSELGHFTQPWQSQIAATRAFLREMGRQATAHRT